MISTNLNLDVLKNFRPFDTDDSLLYFPLYAPRGDCLPHFSFLYTTTAIHHYHTFEMKRKSKFMPFSLTHTIQGHSDILASCVVPAKHLL